MKTIQKILKRYSNRAGTPPGSIEHQDSSFKKDIMLDLIQYDISNFQENEISIEDDRLHRFDKNQVNWLNINDLEQTHAIEKIGQLWGLHPLMVEDILNTGQRPKLEILDHCLFVVVKMISFEQDTHEIEIEQVSFVLLKDLLITFQEKKGDVFGQIRERLRQSLGRIRTMKNDYLMYALIDAIVDHYFVVLEKISNRVDDLEIEVVESPSEKTSLEILSLKKELMLLRKAVVPMRDFLLSLEKSESQLIENETIPFIKDLYDHVIQVSEHTEIFRDTLSGLLDLYMSSISNKANEVMKVLAVIATIFIPLTFIAGVYGMNFEYMPELKWPWSYFIVLTLMVIVGIMMIIYFKKKKWF